MPESNLNKVLPGKAGIGARLRMELSGYSNRKELSLYFRHVIEESIRAIGTKRNTSTGRRRKSTHGIGFLTPQEFLNLFSVQFVPNPKSFSVGSAIM